MHHALVRKDVIHHVSTSYIMHIYNNILARRLTQVLLNDDNINVSPSFSRSYIEENEDFLSD